MTPSMNKIYAVALSAFLMISAGCSLPGFTSDTSSSSDEITSGDPGEKDLCDILTTAEVEAVLGMPVVSDKGSMPQTKFTTGCRYVNEESANSVAILANMDDSAEITRNNYLNAVEFIQESPDLDAEDRIMPDVGTENHAWSIGKSTQINAYQGTVWISLTLITDTQNDYETAAAIARLALQKLQ